MKKYFFFDIDGTIFSHLEQDYIAPSTLEAISQLQDKGHFVGLATGRPQFSVEALAKRVGIHNYVCEGGKGLVVNNDYVHYQAPEQAGMKKLTDYFMKKGYRVYLNINNGSELYSDYITEDQLMRQMHPVILPLKGIVLDNESIHRILVECIDMDVIKNAPSVNDVGYILIPNQKFVVFEPDIKHVGISQMIEYINGDASEVVVFGDGLNDVKMFENVPLKIAMGNAVEPLKAIASHVTDTSHDDGIYKACKLFGWI